MKTWETILVNGFVTIVAVFVAIKLFVPNTPPIDVSKIQETLVNQMKGVQVKLSAIEDGLSNQQTAVSSVTGRPTVRLENLQKMDRKLDMVLGKLSLLETKIDDVQVAPALKRSFPTAMSGQGETGAQTSARKAMNWLENLSEEKRSEVEFIFEENTRRIRERLPLEPDGRLPDRESMKKVMEESDRELKEELKGVLSDEEYQSFLESLPRRSSMKAPAFPGSGIKDLNYGARQ